MIESECQHLLSVSDACTQTHDYISNLEQAKEAIKIREIEYKLEFQQYKLKRSKTFDFKVYERLSLEKYKMASLSQGDFTFAKEEDKLK